jgi:hypothetical protein
MAKKYKLWYKHQVNKLIKKGKFKVINISQEQLNANRCYVKAEYKEITNEGIIIYNNNYLTLYKVVK